jgi:hypothetical protein
LTIVSNFSIECSSFTQLPGLQTDKVTIEDRDLQFWDFSLLALPEDFIQVLPISPVESGKSLSLEKLMSVNGAKELDDHKIYPYFHCGTGSKSSDCQIQRSNNENIPCKSCVKDLEAWQGHNKGAQVEVRILRLHLSPAVYVTEHCMAQVKMTTFSSVR